MHELTISVIGIGEAGNYVVGNAADENYKDVQFYIANGCIEWLRQFPESVNQIVLGKTVTRGLGTGGNPALGYASALEGNREIKKAVDADVVVLVAGLGGGTGSGATPYFAKAAKELGSFTVCVVSTPSVFEGAKRKKQAAESLRELKKIADVIITVDLDKEVSGSYREVFSFAKKQMIDAVESVINLVSDRAVCNMGREDFVLLFETRSNAVFSCCITDKDSNEQIETQLNMSFAKDNIDWNKAGEIFISITAGYDLLMTDIDTVIKTVRSISGIDDIKYTVVMDDKYTSNIKTGMIITERITFYS